MSEANYAQNYDLAEDTGAVRWRGRSPGRSRSERLFGHACVAEREPKAHRGFAARGLRFVAVKQESASQHMQVEARKLEFYANCGRGTERAKPQHSPSECCPPLEGFLLSSGKQ